MKKNKHAVALGKRGGKTKTDAKAHAARENGKKGGRPKNPAPAVVGRITEIARGF